MAGSNGINVGVRQAIRPLLGENVAIVAKAVCREPRFGLHWAIMRLLTD